MIDDVPDYMNSRDFTMNQVILQGNQLILTKRAADDIARGLIRFAQYGDKWYPEHTGDNKFVSDRLAIKAELQRAVLTAGGYDVTIDPEFSPEPSEDYFSLALFLQKATEYGDDISYRFLEDLIKDKLFDGREIYPGSVRETMRIINDELLDYPFEWRGAAAQFAHYPDSQLDVDDTTWADEQRRLVQNSRLASAASRRILDEELVKY